jgi:hypothetical protein
MARTATTWSLFAKRNPRWSDERVVREIARDLVAEAEAEPPVDVEVLASVCGIVRIEQRPFGPSGILLLRDEGWVASVLAVDGLERQRFTVLHEGGHTFLPDFQRSGPHYRCGGTRSRVEHLCDIAAAEMLMPIDDFRSDLAEAGFGMPGVEDLSGAYLASIQATALRAVDLTDGAAALLVLEQRHKPTEERREAVCEPKLRLDWSHRKGEWPYPLRHKSASKTSPVSAAWHEPVSVRNAGVDELFAEPVGPVELSAGRYGDKVLALIRRES